MVIGKVIEAFMAGEVTGRQLQESFAASSVSDIEPLNKGHVAQLLRNNANQDKCNGVC